MPVNFRQHFVFFLLAFFLLLTTWYTKTWAFLWLLLVIVAIYVLYILTSLLTVPREKKATKGTKSMKGTRDSGEYGRGVSGGPTTAYRRKQQHSRTEADTAGADFVDGGEDEVDDGLETVRRIPGYAFILQKIDNNENESDVYKVVFCSGNDKPPNDDDFGPEFKMVPKSCKRVCCVNKAKQIADKKLSEYYVGEDGLYKVPQTSFNIFMAVYNNIASTYKQTP